MCPEYLVLLLPLSRPTLDGADGSGKAVRTRGKTHRQPLREVGRSGMWVVSQHTENHVAHLCIRVEGSASCLRLTALVCQCVQTALLQSLVPSVQGGDGERSARLCAPAPPLRPDRPSRVCRKPCGRRRWISLWGGAVCIVSTGRPPLPSPRPSPSDPAQGRERGAFCGSASSGGG